MGIDFAEGLSTAQIALQVGAIYWCYRISRNLSLARGWGLVWLILMGTIVVMLGSRMIVFVLAVVGDHPALVYVQRYILPTLVSVGLFLGTWLLHRWIAKAEVIIPTLRILPPARISINEASIVVAWDREAEQLFGFSAQAAIGRSLTELIIPTHHIEAHLEAIARFLGQGESAQLQRPAYHIDAHDASGQLFEVKIELSVTREGGATTFHAQIWRARYDIYSGPDTPAAGDVWC